MTHSNEVTQDILLKRLSLLQLYMKPIRNGQQQQEAPDILAFKRKGKEEVLDSSTCTYMEKPQSPINQSCYEYRYIKNVQQHREESKYAASFSSHPLISCQRPFQDFILIMITSLYQGRMGWKRCGRNLEEQAEGRQQTIPG